MCGAARSARERRCGMDELSGKAALVTGAGSGIGRGIALALAREGVNVALADVEGDTAAAVAREVAALEVEAFGVRLDVTDEAAQRALAERVEAEWGGLHVVCLNAGVLSSELLSEATEADWQWTFGVNLFGVARGVRACLPALRRRAPEAHILITASVAGLRPNEAAPIGIYSASKHAVVAYADVLHDELAAEGIGVSALCPGGVRTKISVAGRNRPDDYGGPNDAAVFGGGGGSGLSRGMDAEEAGRIAVRGLKAGRRLVLTHPETRAQVAARHQRIMDEYDFLEAANAAETE